ncbi:pyrimidine 5'-nucleotidase [Thauera sp. CAU 1555]|uniref:Pyrimidine 5'-nucleotidase n=1 Tax=Thauera sedimentorum TaxID=2767595 RepID=A0ABR9BEJ3_9RHOO|nr:pyrimidine 5'-nucleotidase [Thauera sedimentorum]MBC9073847.1 pyrimidine 5'-nucleotidase [Thauera sedimentorum]MBD8504766.1 pyrimidine 5'-nucleotidase [Thauera sedimentorum]
MTQAPVWLFDLDNTLHNASPHIFPHINRSMTAYLERHLGLSTDEANALRVGYWRRYGATLTGLMRHHGTDPHHFLDETHRFDRLHELMVFDRALGGLLRTLPGPKIVFSNGPQRYAETVLELMGVRRLFADVFGIERMKLHPKPAIRAYREVLRAHRLNPRRCILVEDSPDNLRTARRLGIRTVWVSRSLRSPAYVDLKIASVLDLRRGMSGLLR